MTSLTQIFRLIHISYVLLKHGLDDVVLATHLFRPLRFIRLFLPWMWFRRNLDSRGERIRGALEDLGPLFIKFGQILSTRRDLLPDDIANQLAMLQDQVKPFSSQLAVKIIEEAYGQNLSEVFSRFDHAPLASASIAQVHTATLPNGKDVIVKVVRPGIRKAINRDIRLLRTMADLAWRYWPDGRRLRPREVVTEYEKTLIDELDLLREAANASQLRRNFQDSEILYVPEVEWDLSRRNVLVMERISGIAISDTESLRKANVNFKLLAERGVEIFFTQVFIHSFFHADMHPGNIFADKNARYIAVDFGIMGSLAPQDQHYLAENFLAFFNRDYRRVAELHIQSKWVPSDTRVDQFESAIRTVCEPIFQRPLKEISFGQLLLRLFQVARRFNMEVQPQLVLLQKTLLNIEGLGRQLYPDLDLWQTAKPFLEQWAKNQVGPSAIIQRWTKQFPNWANQLPELPSLVYDALQKVREDRIQLQWTNPQLGQIKAQIQLSNRRTVGGILAAACLISAALLAKHTGLGYFAGFSSSSWLLFSIAVILGIYSWPSRNGE